MNCFRYFLLLLLLYSTKCLSQDLPDALKKKTIDTLAYALLERYAYKDVAKDLNAMLLANYQRGKYDQYNQSEEFARAITNDLRSLNKDKHLSLNFQPVQPLVPNTVPSNTETNEERLRRISSFNRQMNYGFEQVAFYPGNVGYIKFNYFDAFPEHSRAVMDASFAFLKNSDAIIIDLRDNTGGASATVSYIAGYFFDSSTLIGRSYNRYTDSITDEYLQPATTEKRLSKADLYILTSKTTISAAEALAYVLKYLKKGTVIGETSAGAANPGRVVRLNPSFTAFIPNRHSMNIITGTSWEGTGVPVDIEVPASKALSVAIQESLKKLRNSKTDTMYQRKLTTYLSYHQAAKDQKFSARHILPYVGRYESDREINMAEGKLYYTAPAETGGELVMVAPDVFVTSGGVSTVRFNRNTKGKILSMSVLWTLGTKPQFYNKL